MFGKISITADEYKRLREAEAEINKTHVYRTGPGLPHWEKKFDPSPKKVFTQDDFHSEIRKVLTSVISALGLTGYDDIVTERTMPEYAIDGYGMRYPIGRKKVKRTDFGASRLLSDVEAAADFEKGNKAAKRLRKATEK